MVRTLISNTHNHGIFPVVMRVKILLLIRYSIVYLLGQISFMTTSVFILCLMGRGCSANPNIVHSLETEVAQKEQNRRRRDKPTKRLEKT